MVVEVVVHTFLGEIVGDYQSSLSFFVEKSTGIVVQMTYFNRNYQYGENNFGRYGYCLMLMLDGTSVEFPTSQWKFAPIYFAIGCLALASIISAIIKKVEY